MKTRLLTLLGVALCLGTLVPPPAEAQTVVVRHYPYNNYRYRGYYYGPEFRFTYRDYDYDYGNRYWVPGHWVWRHHERIWIPGHYVWRSYY